MNKKLALGILSILAIITSLFYSNSAAAEKNSADQLVSTTVVISQVYGGGGGSTGTYQFDYVELKNVSSGPQSLSGLSLYYGSATGNFASSSTNAFALPSVTLQPGQYYLVQLGSAGSGGAPLPVTADAVNTTVAMSGTSGKIALVNASALPINTCGSAAAPCNATQLAAIVDWVAYGAAGNGTAGNGEGGTAVNNGSPLTSTQGAVRKNGGCQDTDNNNNDFNVVTAPVPRNTSTPLAPCGTVVVNTQHVSDYNGDGKTDFALVRNTGGGAGGQVTWFINLNGTATTYGSAWGISTDTFVPADYDGDNKTDIAVWRAGAPTVAAFYILQSNGNTVRIEQFGQTGDDPSVVNDYDGDGKVDVAVYRQGAAAGQQSTWFYRGSLNNPGGNVTYIPWGQNGDFPTAGDFDGDGRGDFVVQRDNGNGQGRFWMLQTTAGIEQVVFGASSDSIVPGDFDGDGKSDLAVARASGGQYHWFVRPSSTGVINGGPTAIFGAPATDFIAPGDYDGDGKTDFAVWRSLVSGSTFWVLGSTSGAFSVPFGTAGDYPPANTFVN